jgi:flavin reductase (DIM6/NTAB) family NADH-FMN oxidoreductase RutF
MKEGYKKQGFLNPAFFVPSYNKWIYYWVSTQFLITFSRAIRFHFMQSFSIDQIKLMDRFTRTHFINTLSGFKSVSLMGTLNKEGQANLAIFSNLVHLGADPALIGFINRPLEAAPHTLTNIQETEFYTVNHVHKGIYTEAHQTSAKYPAHVSEFEAVGLRPLFRPGISAPFVEESKVQYLLKLEEIIPIKLNGTFLVVGSLQQAFVQEDIMNDDGYLAIEKANSLCSLGINGYYETNFLDKLPYAKP